MHTIKLLLIVLSMGLTTSLIAQDELPRYIKIDKAYRYRVYFTDKDDNPYSVKRPEAFLSKKSIERRRKLKLKVDRHDLPVTPKYLDHLRENGFRIHNVSKWNNTAVVEVTDSNKIKELKNVSFISEVRKVWESRDSVMVFPEFNRISLIENKCDTIKDIDYGATTWQNDMLNVGYLHENDYKGQGMTIAVIDGGFFNADSIRALKGCKILGTRNFVDPKKSVYEEIQDHGTMVLTCIATNLPNVHIGTAPEASFYLLQSEDTSSEQLVEEDNWCSAVEYADSLGVDVITSSLGYYSFDHAEMNHEYHEQDGKTAINSRSASLAASRGLLVLNSAGNEGNDAWKKIGFPADATGILTVGAVNRWKRNAIFSSIGNTTDGRIKPDVMAMGKDASVFDHRGNLEEVDGTSFSCPILCGAVACLWQAFPTKKPTEIIKAVRAAGNNVEHPNNIYGYGIPDFEKAFEILKGK